MCVSFGEIAVCLQVTQGFKITSLSIGTEIQKKSHILVTNIFFQNFKAPKMITLSAELSNLALSFRLKRKQIFSLFELFAQFHVKIADEQRRPSKTFTINQK